MGLPCGLPQISQSYLRGLPFEKVGDPSNSYKRWSDIESNTTPTTKASFVGQSLGFTRLWPSKRDITNIYESLPRSNHFSLIQTPVSSPFTFSDVLPPSFPSSHPNVWIVYSMSSSDNKSQKNVAANLLIVDSSPDATIFQCKWRISKDFFFLICAVRASCFSYLICSTVVLFGLLLIISGRSIDLDFTLQGQFPITVPR